MAKNYETLDDLLKEDIHWMSEDENSYYVTLELEPGEYYDNSIWVVDKKTGKVSYADILELVLLGDLEERTTPVDPSTLKRAS